jgi:hypothetical protein
MVHKLVGLTRNVRDRAVSPVSLTVIFAVLAGICLWQGLRPDPVAVRGNLASDSSQTTSSTPKYRTQEIRNITLGTWVLADNPELPGDVEGDYGEYDAATWRTIALRMTKEDGAQLDIRLARPLSWIDETHAAVGATIFLDMEEMGAVGDAEVLSIGPFPEIQPRPSQRHSLVTGKFVHSSGDFLNLYVDGLREPIGTTSNHPFWSEDRQQFVQAGRLKIGENLRLQDGRLKPVTQVSKREGVEGAYNLEVDGEHVYYVSKEAVLVHNSYPKRITMGVHEHIDDFTRTISKRTGSKADAFPFLSLTKKTDGPWQGVHRAIHGADEIHFSLKGMTKSNFQEWMRKGLHKCEPVLRQKGWTNRELYEVLTGADGALLKNATFYDDFGKVVDAPLSWLL